jgi:hypothetical protein
MPDLLASAAQLTHPPIPPLGLTELVGNKLTFQQIAAALGCSERSVYNVVDQFRIPYVRVLGKRLVDPADFRAALAKQQANTAPRGRGRPQESRLTKTPDAVARAGGDWFRQSTVATLA